MEPAADTAAPLNTLSAMIYSPSKLRKSQRLSLLKGKYPGGNPPGVSC